jgi:hypothetical protein
VWRRQPAATSCCCANSGHSTGEALSFNNTHVEQGHLVFVALHSTRLIIFVVRV